ncbi:hypothetical protein C8R43DRAFT_22505 [Mycena crocata]|nr:hypothetical protein C8R43DRAFT_22505 [Mycena crocata]
MSQHSRSNSSSSQSSQSSGDDAPSETTFSSSVTIHLYTPMIAHSLTKPDGFLCTPALSYIFRFITLHDDWEVGMRNRYHSTLDQLVAFLLSPKNIDKYASDWSICRIPHQERSSPMIASFHKTMHKHAPPSTFNALIVQMCSFLAAIVKELHVQVDDVDLWPSSAAALFPAGAKNAVLSLLQLYRRTDDMEPLRLLVALLHHLPSDNSLLSAFLDTPAFIAALADDFKTNVDKMRVLHRSKQESPGHKVENKVLHFGMFWRDFIMAVGYQKYEPLRTYMRPQAEKIYGSMGVLLETYRAQMQKDARAMVLMLLYQAPLTFSTSLLSSHSDDDPNNLVDPASILHGALSEVQDKNTLNCARALCHKRTDTSLCSGCRLFRYCSAKCQREAWVWKTVPHKLVCKDFAKLVMIKGETKSEDEFEGRLKAGGFGDDKTRDMLLALTLHEHDDDKLLKGK